MILDYSQPSIYLIHDVGNVAQGLIAPADLLENESPVLRTQVRSLITTCHFNTRRCNTLLLAFAYTHIQVVYIHIYVNINKK